MFIIRGRAAIVDEIAADASDPRTVAEDLATLGEIVEVAIDYVARVAVTAEPRAPAS